MENKYVLLSKNFEPDYFDAEDDKTAERYVEENYTQEDGEMTLYRLTPLVDWP